MEDRAKSLAAGHLCRGRRYRRRGSAGAGPAEGTRSDPADQVSGQEHSQGSDGARIVPLWTNPANHAAGSLAAARALVIQDCRLELRGKNDSVRLPGIHRPRCIRWRDDGSRANRVIRSATILPNAVPIAGSRDARDPAARRQSGTVVFASPLDATSLSSMFRWEATEQGLAPRPVGSSHRHVAVWGAVFRPRRLSSRDKLNQNDERREASGLFSRWACASAHV